MTKHWSFPSGPTLIAVFVVAALITPVPAHAVTKSYSYSLVTPQNTYAGSAAASGKVTFTGMKTGSITGTVTDRCPADGAGAYFGVTVNYGNGSGYFDPDFAVDTNGCGNGSTSISKPIPNPESRNITRVTVRVCATDMDADPPFSCLEVDYSPLFDNPNV